jgi:hypothetical protein
MLIILKFVSFSRNVSYIDLTIISYNILLSFLGKRIFSTVKKPLSSPSIIIELAIKTFS